MKPPPFDYERPVDINGALASLASHGGRAKVLAGGQSLLAMLNLRLLSPERLIDVSRLDELKYIRVAGNELRIGALTTHNTVLKSADVTMRCPIMAEAYRHVSHHSVRNRGTIGGSLCHNDPAARNAARRQSARRLAGGAKQERRAHHCRRPVFPRELRDRARG